MLLAGTRLGGSTRRGGRAQVLGARVEHPRRGGAGRQRQGAERQKQSQFSVHTSDIETGSVTTLKFFAMAMLCVYVCVCV